MADRSFGASILRRSRERGGVSDETRRERATAQRREGMNALQRGIDAVHSSGPRRWFSNMADSVTDGLLLGASEKAAAGLETASRWKTDRLRGGNRGWVDIYRDVYDKYKRSEDARKEANPIASTVGEIGGAVLPMFVTGGVNALAGAGGLAGAGRLGAVSRSGLVGAGHGAAGGLAASSGWGSGQGFDLGRTALDTTVGGAIGGAGGVAVDAAVAPIGGWIGRRLNIGRNRATDEQIDSIAADIKSDAVLDKTNIKPGSVMGNVSVDDKVIADRAQETLDTVSKRMRYLNNARNERPQDVPGLYGDNFIHATRQAATRRQADDPLASSDTLDKQIAARRERFLREAEELPKGTPEYKHTMAAYWRSMLDDPSVKNADITVFNTKDLIQKEFDALSNLIKASGFTAKKKKAIVKRVRAEMKRKPVVRDFARRSTTILKPFITGKKALSKNDVLKAWFPVVKARFDEVSFGTGGITQRGRGTDIWTNPQINRLTGGLDPETGKFLNNIGKAREHGRELGAIENISRNTTQMMRNLPMARFANLLNPDDEFNTVRQRLVTEPEYMENTFKRLIQLRRHGHPLTALPLTGDRLSVTAPLGMAAGTGFAGVSGDERRRRMLLNQSRRRSGGQY